ncbi:MAG TPA: hypothetical protein VG757_10445 [Devosia sp.]|nr:hypothetical protein [Devosia sp.]
MRVVQPEGSRGSLKWIQRAVNDRPSVIKAALVLGGLTAEGVEWLSPVRADAYAEYRDVAFLERIGSGHLASALADFWPRRGPQWDALARADDEILLVEAKAHVSEMLSPPTAASEKSRRQIERALAQTIEAFDARPLAAWTDVFYQLANRYAFLHLLNSRGVPARLALVNFVGDTEMSGPRSSAEWAAAYEVADHVMGLSRKHPYASRIHHVFVDVQALT